VLDKVRDWLAIGLGAVMLQAFCIASVQAAETPIAETSIECPKKTRCVAVADPYLELRSGAGVGYPIFHVVGRGDQIAVLKRRTDWFYVRTHREIEGWVSRSQMLATLELTGEPIALREPSRSDYANKHWEAGAFIGRFDGASLLGVFTGYGLSDHLTAELTLSMSGNNVASNSIATLGLNHTFAPEWWVSPYAGIGTGVIQISPRATLVQAIDRIDQIGYVAFGARGYIGRRFLLRAEYRSNVVFTSRNKNEEADEWKLGFAFFF
jgi:hypothetical protein